MNNETLSQMFSRLPDRIKSPDNVWHYICIDKLGSVWRCCYRVEDYNGNLDVSIQYRSGIIDRAVKQMLDYLEKNKLMPESEVSNG